ncbi:hypothetical protein Nepgr_002722 [Nepenthes gracilis]|uniref:Uncharacterized protein n=1 Tax=Nepenthes gracilis TaxID=150966 RepID=A0AAD3P7I2_NEPGR|nr:hypothetical protein Nepgr_002722 [Nepenthes gracilis]
MPLAIVVEEAPHDGLITKKPAGYELGAEAAGDATSPLPGGVGPEEFPVGPTVPGNVDLSPLVLSPVTAPEPYGGPSSTPLPKALLDSLSVEEETPIEVWVPQLFGLTL